MDDLSTKADNTKESYIRNLNKFLDRWEVTAEELYEMRKSDLASEDTRDRGNVDRRIKIQMSELQKAGYSANSIKVFVRSLTSFFDSQGLPLKIRPRDIPRGAVNGQKLAMIRDIKKMWDYAPTESKLKTRALLAFAKDAGLRVGDISRLDMKHYLDAKRIEVNDEIFVVFNPFETQKSATPAFVHIGPETVNALDLYLGERGQPSPDEPLFLNRFGDRCSEDSVGWIFRRLAKTLGIKGVSAHSFRKYHTTMLQSAGLNDSWIKCLQGKSIGGSMGPYTKAYESGELTKTYIEVYDKLRIFGEQVSTQTIEEQANDIEQLREIVIKQGEYILQLMKRLDASAIDKKTIEDLTQIPIPKS
jgi:Site-specific recombinase XerD